MELHQSVCEGRGEPPSLRLRSAPTDAGAGDAPLGCRRRRGSGAPWRRASSRLLPPWRRAQRFPEGPRSLFSPDTRLSSFLRFARDLDCPGSSCCYPVWVVLASRTNSSGVPTHSLSLLVVGVRCPFT
jgi:hypothetical protein